MNCPIYTVKNARLIEVRKLRDQLVLVFDRKPNLEPTTNTNDRGYPITVYEALAVVRLDTADLPPVVESPPCSE